MPVKSLPGEKWEPVKDTKAFVSNYGRVKKGTRLLSIAHDGDGDKHVCVSGKNYLLHILVAKAFVPNPNNLPVVDHKDTNKDNCRADNLEWVTHQENTQRYYDKKKEKGEKIVHRRTNIIAIDREDNAVLYDSQSAAARELSLDVKVINKAVRGILKTVKGFRFFRIETFTDNRTLGDEQ